MILTVITSIIGIAILAIVFWDTFETIVLSKTVRRKASFSGFYFSWSWALWSLVVRKAGGRLRTSALVSFGPLSLIGLVGVWAVALIFGFAFIHYGSNTIGPSAGLVDDLYFSGVTFFTLGYGDQIPLNPMGKFLSVVEAGTGFGFLAVVIGYLPIMYGEFARRETAITLLDSKAGSEPSAGELLRRHAEAGVMEELVVLLKEWEGWSAQQLETFLSYPVMAFYRSQHDDQSWIKSITCILDTCTIIIAGFDYEQDQKWAKSLDFQARATFTMARHVIVDLAYILDIPPDEHPPSRVSEPEWQNLRQQLGQAGLAMRSGREEKIANLRELYEGYVVSLARDLFFVLPAWLPQPGAKDNWQTSAWDHDGHF